MTAVRENRFLPSEFYGADVPVGDAWSPATLPGVSFRSAWYGLAVGDRFGLAVVVQVRLGALLVGRAILYAWGTASTDQLDGTVGYLLDFSDGIGGLLLRTNGDQYPFLATRVP
jgi:hypothetical protein